MRSPALRSPTCRRRPSGIRWPVDSRAQPKLQPKWRIATTSPRNIRTYYARVSKDIPSCRAFCRIAPTVRLNRLANWGADRFARANFLNSRTSIGFQARRFSFLLFLATRAPNKVVGRHTTRFIAVLVKSLRISSLCLTKSSELLFNRRLAGRFLETQPTMANRWVRNSIIRAKGQAGRQ
jgi:hypothetical protein